jgi:hypothetical protein
MNIVGIIVLILVLSIVTHLFFKHVASRYRKLSLIGHIGKCVLLALNNADGWDDLFVDMIDDFKTSKRMQENTLDDFEYLSSRIHELHGEIQGKRGEVTILVPLDESRVAANKATQEILEELASGGDTILDRTEDLELRILPSIKDLMDIKWGTVSI